MLYTMSSVNTNPLWLGEKATVKSKYEKCQDITSEIYKRINITFAIRNLETKETVSDAASDLIDSNELSNGTDLFAYEKTDSLSSSVTLDETFKSPRKVINLNNNEETLKKPRQRFRRAKKRFRKRVKKKLARRSSDTDCSSDEAPLSRIVVDCKKRIDAKRLLEKRVKPLSIAVAKVNDVKAGNDEESSDSAIKEAETSKTNPVEEALSEQMAKEYEFFSKVMEEVGEESDLDAVLMPALYPEVDLYERKLGLPRQDITYYTFADLVNAGPSTSRSRLAISEFTKVHNEAPSKTETSSPTADTKTEKDEVVKSPGNTENSENTKMGECIAPQDPSAASVNPISDAKLDLESSSVLYLESTVHKESNSEDHSNEDLKPMNLSIAYEELGDAETRNGVERKPKKAPERKECDVCKLTFSGVRGLKRHMKSRCKGRTQDAQPAETTRRHACAVCGQSYTRRIALREHARSHRGERHVCALCDKSFTRYDTWRRHQRVHTETVAVAPR